MTSTGAAGCRAQGRDHRRRRAAERSGRVTTYLRRPQSQQPRPRAKSPAVRRKRIREARAAAAMVDLFQRCAVCREPGRTADHIDHEGALDLLTTQDD